ncbi:MAG: glycosyltransferase [Desulfuromonadales bacterium]|nr:glycosyltransferase [Desulfuromonadales bacterium]
MREAKVSVILTVLNEGEGMTTLLEALFTQTRQPDEIVIVDGGSKDNTLEILNDYAVRDKRLKVFVEAGVNIAWGRNIAIQKASHPIIAVTDGGCRPERNWLEELVRPLLEDDSYAAVAGAFQVDWRSRFEFFSGNLCMPSDSGDARTRLFYGRNSAFRKEAWEAAGGYPEWLYTGEDTLFAKRVLECGYRVAWVPGAVVAWRPRPTLRKLGKMFFLYGRGNGRIENGSIKGSLYWLRYHLAWVLTLLAGFFFPWLWLVTLAVLVFLSVQMVPGTMEAMKMKSAPKSRWLWVPLIVFVRNIATNVGYLFGRWELRQRPEFRNQLEEYRQAPESRS